MFLLLLGACDTRASPDPCPHAMYVPEGPIVEDRCDCPPDTILFWCEGNTCAGEPWQYTCEQPAAVAEWMRGGCADCLLEFDEEGPFWAMCPRVY